MAWRLRRMRPAMPASTKVGIAARDALDSRNLAETMGIFAETIRKAS